MSALSEALNEANTEGWSAAEIARRSGDRIHRATAANVMRGKHAANPSDEVLEAFAVVFPQLSLQRLRELAGRPAGEDEPYHPPAEAARLNARQRRAVDELIRAMVDVEVLQPDEHDEWTRLGVPRGIPRDQWLRRRPAVLAELEQDAEDLDDAIVEAGRRQLREAARAGTPNLRSVKDRQDRAGETPDPEGPEGGA